jgi:uncharacterized Zn ribbon protein
MIFIKKLCPHCNSSMVYEEWGEVRCLMCARRVGRIVKERKYEAQRNPVT